jgi:CIC family chloride channel protein
MGSVIAAATNAPMTGILMVFEMTDNSAIMLPLMLSVVVSHAVARRLERDSLYSGWLRRRGEHIQHGQDQDALASLRVADAYDPSPTVIGGDAVATRFLSHLGTVHQEVFPVVAEDSSLLGVLSVEDLMRIARRDSQDQSRLVARVAARPSETLAAEDSLLEAVRRMGVRGVAALPVVDRATGRLRGLLTQSDVGGLYGRLLAGVPMDRSRDAAVSRGGVRVPKAAEAAEERHR